MNPDIREAIIQQFSKFPINFSIEIVKTLVRDKGLSEAEILRTLHWMADKGEIDLMKGGLCRLTLKGQQASAPLRIRAKYYMADFISTHWLAIIALCVSIVALFKK